MPFHCAPCRIRSRQKTVAEVECKPIEIQPAAWRFVENLPSSALPSLSRTLICDVNAPADEAVRLKA